MSVSDVTGILICESQGAVIARAMASARRADRRAATGRDSFAYAFESVYSAAAELCARAAPTLAEHNDEVFGDWLADCPIQGVETS